MNKLFAIMVFAISCTGCMSNKEFCVRMADIEAKKAYPPVYTPYVFHGPGKVELDAGGQLAITVPSLPYQNTPIPDGQAIQANLVKNLATLGALLYGTTYGIRKANGDSNTTINNNGGTN